MEGRAALALVLALMGAGCGRSARAERGGAPAGSAAPYATVSSSAAPPGSASPVGSAAPADSGPKPGERVLVLGDSHILGIFGATFDGLLRAKPGRQVWTYGSCGSAPTTWLKGMETPCGGFEHVEGQPAKKTGGKWRTPSLASLISTIRPQRTIVVLGGNFIWSAADTAPFIHELVEVIRKGESGCVWVGPPEIPDRTEPDDTQVRKHKAMEKLYRILRDETGAACALLDSRAMGIRRWDTFDNYHVGPVAAAQWSDAVIRAVDAPASL